MVKNDGSRIAVKLTCGSEFSRTKFRLHLPLYGLVLIPHIFLLFGTLLVQVAVASGVDGMSSTSNLLPSCAGHLDGLPKPPMQFETPISIQIANPVSLDNLDTLIFSSNDFEAIRNTAKGLNLDRPRTSRIGSSYWLDMLSVVYGDSKSSEEQQIATTRFNLLLEYRFLPPNETTSVIDSEAPFFGRLSPFRAVGLAGDYERLLQWIEWGYDVKQESWSYFSDNRFDWTLIDFLEKHGKKDLARSLVESGQVAKGLANRLRALRRWWSLN